MCRNITTLRGLDPPVTPAEIEAASRQFVRKVSGVQNSSPATAETMERAISEISKAVTALVDGLPPRRQSPPTVPPLRRPEVRARLGLPDLEPG